MRTCVYVCMYVLYVCGHQASTLPCLPMSTLKAAWSAMNKAILEHLWFDSPALLPTCRSHSTRSWHANCTDSRKHPASLESDTSLQHRSKSIQQNDLHELQFHFITSSWKQGCMQEALHGLAHSLLGSKCRRAWNNLVESRAQYPRNCAAIGIFSDFLESCRADFWMLFPKASPPGKGTWKSPKLDLLVKPGYLEHHRKICGRRLQQCS
jgi:hypothetical protein